MVYQYGLPAESAAWPPMRSAKVSDDSTVLVHKRGAHAMRYLCGCVAGGVDAATSDEELVQMVLKALVDSVKQVRLSRALRMQLQSC